MKKNIINIIAIAVITAGCATTPAEQKDQCAKWAAIVAAYEVSKIDRVPSADEQRAAAVASALLAMHCNAADSARAYRADTHSAEIIGGQTVVRLKGDKKNIYVVGDGGNLIPIPAP